MSSKNTKEHHQLASNHDDSGRLVLVEWLDARLYPDTMNEKRTEDCRLPLFISVGYLVRRDNVTTAIAAERNDEGDYRQITLIPTGSIQAIKELALGPSV